MPLTAATITRSPDWPLQVKAPGTHDWERSATRWLRDLLPARYGGYLTLTRHPALLVRHVQLQLQHEMRAVQVALQTSRAELPRLGVAESVIENTIRMYAVELEQLSRLARGVRLVSDALVVRTPAQRKP
uniref:Transposase n=1 Tax=Streptomyces sp. NBC_00049 TaxID=2903617 RepID=A0AAU2K396_9ACTN